MGETEELLRDEVERLTPLVVLYPELVGTRWTPALVLVEDVEEVALESVRRVC